MKQRTALLLNVYSSASFLNKPPFDCEQHKLYVSTYFLPMNHTVRNVCLTVLNDLPVLIVKERQVTQRCFICSNNYLFIYINE